MECEQADRARSVVRQGDILAAHPGTKNWSNRWGRFYVVLSADCDIVNSKLDTGLVVVPIVGLETYARDVWLPEQIRRQSDSALKKIEAMARSFTGWSHTPQSILSMSKSEVEIELVKLVDNDSNNKKAAERIRKIHHGSSLLRGVEVQLGRNEIALHGLVSTFSAAKAGITESPSDPGKELKAGLASVADPKRSDYWPIFDLVGLDGQMREEELGGFVAALRRFTKIQPSLATVDRSEWLNSQEAYLRICRLRGIYKTDFLQKFANLFIRVGLDAGRDNEHERMFETTAARLMKSKGGGV